MATILLVDDRSANREYLAALLSSSGYRVEEACDGAEALERVRATRPDLIIADILMPKIDGYEFVRQLRSEPSISHTPVILLTAHYAREEIHPLVSSCGVFQVITKPVEPEAILSSVSKALDERAVAVDVRPSERSLEQFDKHHLRLLTDKLARKAAQLEVANHRLSALVDLGRQLGAERDPRQLLSNFCQAAADIYGARYAMVAVIDEQSGELRLIVACADDPSELGHLNARSSAEALVQRFIKTERAVLIDEATNLPQQDELPIELAALGSLLVAPIHTISTRYGLLCIAGLRSSVHDDDSFTKLASSMGSVLGVAYENALRHEQIDRHAERLRHEVTERTLAQEEVQRLNAELEQRVAERTAELETSHQRLRQSERMAAMGTFSAGLGHDITNMLLPVRGHLAALRQDLPEEDFQRRIDSIHSCMDYLHSLTRGLRMLTLDPENGNDEATTDLVEWRESVEPLLRSMVPRSVMLQWNFPEVVSPVAIESHRLTQAVFNLVKNASDALKERSDGEISVEIKSSNVDGMMRFEVIDNGPGMSEDVRKRALEPFFTTKTRDFSTGLGLSMVYGIAKGKMTLNSEPGRGTRVSIDVPVAVQGAVRTEEPDRSAAQREDDSRPKQESAAHRVTS